MYQSYCRMQRVICLNRMKCDSFLKFALVKGLHKKSSG
jgi:hypothetical protein